MSDYNPEQDPAYQAAWASFSPGYANRMAMDNAFRAGWIASREVRAAEADEDDTIVTCVRCSVKHSVDECTPVGEGEHYCPNCYAEWLKYHRACEHKWVPHTDYDHGEQGRLCQKCLAFFADDIQPDTDGRLERA